MMTRSRKRSICLARNLFWVGTVVALGVATDVRSQDFSTGFELDRPGPLGFGALDIKEVFTLGDSPKSVTFSNARVAKKGQHFLLEDLPRKGEGAWIVGCQRIGVIVFETPATGISFYLREARSGNISETPVSKVTMLTENFLALQEYKGKPLTWVHVDYDGPPVAS